MRLSELGVSQRESWERCLAYHYYSYLAGENGIGIVPVSYPYALLWGGIGHKGLAEWYSQLRVGTSPEDAVASAKQVLVDEKNTLMDKWKESEKDLDEKELHVQKSFVLLDSFIDGYAKFYEDDKKFNIVAVEWEFNIPAESFYPSEIIDSVTKLYGVELPNVRGTVDFVAEGRDGVWVVMDHKFNSMIETDLEPCMTFWKQPTIYARAVHLLWGARDVVYVHNQIRKPSGNLAPRMEKGRQESADEFLERIRDDYLLYPDYLDDLYPRGKKGYFYRASPLAISFDSKRFLAELACQDSEMVVSAGRLPERVGWKPPPPFLPRRHSACKKWGGKPCEYHMLCTFGHNPVTVSHYVEREEPHT